MYKLAKKKLDKPLTEARDKAYEELKQNLQATKSENNGNNLAKI